jgi:hypothetical protein
MVPKHGVLLVVVSLLVPGRLQPARTSRPARRPGWRDHRLQL